MQVAILGTGKMGGAMARRLEAAGHELTVWNRTRSRAEALGVGTVNVKTASGTTTNAATRPPPTAGTSSWYMTPATQLASWIRTCCC